MPGTQLCSRRTKLEPGTHPARPRRLLRRIVPFPMCKAGSVIRSRLIGDRMMYRARRSTVGWSSGSTVTRLWTGSSVPDQRMLPSLPARWFHVSIPIVATSWRSVVVFRSLILPVIDSISTRDRNTPTPETRQLPAAPLEPRAPTQFIDVRSTGCWLEFPQQIEKRDRLLRVGEHILAPRESVVHMVQTSFDQNPWRSRHSVNLRNQPVTRSSESSDLAPIHQSHSSHPS